MSNGLITLAFTGMAIAIGTFANDAIKLRILDADKFLERDHTVQIAMADHIKVMPVTVLQERGNMRRIATTIVDMRSRYHAPAISMVVGSATLDEPDVRRKLRKAPVYRMMGIMNCSSRRVDWRAMEYAPSMISRPKYSSDLQDAHFHGKFPSQVSAGAAEQICNLKPALT